MSTKTCPQCRNTKPVTDEFWYFHSNPRKPTSYCRECAKENGRRSTWWKDNREKKATFNKNWRLRNPSRRKLMVKAGWAVYLAVKKGDLIRPTHCSKCHREGLVEGAHYDYSKLLDVIWLCRSCHRTWDSNEPKSL